MLRRELDNGLRILTHRNAAAPALALQVWVQVGSADERDGEFGLAHVHEHMLFKGTERRPVGRIAAEVESSGGEINAYTSFDQTVFHVVLSSRYFSTGLDVLCDAVRCSSFDETELSRELDVVLEEIRRSDDSAARVAAELLFRTAFQEHPYRRPVIGSVESVQALSREKILRFYRRWYTGRNIVVVAVGDLDEAAAADEIAAAFATLTPGTPGPPRTPEPRQNGLRYQRQESRFQQLHLGVGLPIPNASHDDVPALDLLSLVVGQGESSRLNQVVRRERGLVTDVVAYPYTPRDAGLWVVSATMHPEKAQEATGAILEQLFRLRHEPVSAEELEKARTIIESQQVYERESVQGQARKYGFYETLAGGAEGEALYLRRIRSLRPDDLLTVARRYLLPDALNVAVLAPSGDESGPSEEMLRELVAAAMQRPEHGTASGDESQPAAPQSVAGSSAPGSRTPRASEPETPVELTLCCGTRLVLVPDRSLPLVSVRAVALGGLLREPEGAEGISRLMASTVTKGTTTRTAAQVAEATERMAAAVMGSSGRHTVGLRTSMMTRYLDPVWEVFVDTMLRPAFRAEDVDREKALQLEQIRVQRDRAGAYTLRNLVDLVYRGHPNGRSVLGTTESVAGLTEDGLREMHRVVFGEPGELVLAVCGDIDVDRFVRRVEDAFGGADLEAPGVAAPLPLHLSSGRQERLLRGPGAQAHIAVGYPAIRYADPRRTTLDVLVTVLSGQGGRLFLDLRDRRSLAYSVTASSFEGYDSGYFFAYMGTRPKKVAEGLEGLEAALGELTSSQVTEDELTRAQRYIVGTFDIGLQRRAARAATHAYNRLFGSPERKLEEYTDRILATTTDDIRALATELFQPDRASVCIYEPDKT